MSDTIRYTSDLGPLMEGENIAYSFQVPGWYMVLGLILVIAMLTMPAAIAGQYVRDIKRMMVWASALGVLFTVAGLWLSYAWDLTSGASIIVVAGVGYLVSLGVRPLVRRVGAGKSRRPRPSSRAMASSTCSRLGLPLRA